jgi:hypothetical protein
MTGSQQLLFSTDPKDMDTLEDPSKYEYETGIESN